jgi:hypothetical protein
MATINTAERTAQLEQDFKLTVKPSMLPLQRDLKIAKWGTIALTADSVTANDTIVLGSVGVSGTIHPALCRLVGLSGSVGGTFKLQKVNAAGTATDLTGLATLATDGVEVPFLRATGALPAFEKGDVLRLIIGTATALAAGDTIEVVLGYSADEVQ